jgi:cytoskeletal protein RodZ
MNLESPGEKLKKIRQEKGLSLEEVQKKTKIHINILKAIEGEGLTNLSPIYLKSFLKIYCKFLGLDPKEYMPDYKEQPQAQIQALQAKHRKSLSFFETASIKLGTFRPSKKVKKIFIFILTIAFIGIGLFGLGKLISFMGKSLQAKRKIQIAKTSKIQKPTPKTQNTQIKSSAAKITPKEIPPVSEIALQKEASSGINLGIVAKEKCWVYLKVDGRVVFQRILEKGRFESWKAKERMELSLGDAGAVELQVNEQVFSHLGRRGQSIKNIIITKEGLKIPR